MYRVERKPAYQKGKKLIFHNHGNCGKWIWSKSEFKMIKKFFCHVFIAVGAVQLADWIYQFKICKMEKQLTY